MYTFFCHLLHTASERILFVNVKNRKFNNICCGLSGTTSAHRKIAVVPEHVGDLRGLQHLSTLRIPPYYDTHGGIPMLQQGHSQSLTM